jgi:tetratricopeptide (TPR) repeat protein
MFLFRKPVFVILLISVVLANCSTKYPPLDLELLSSLGETKRGGFQEGVDLNKLLIAEDSSNINAWIGLAESHIILHLFGYVSREEAIPEARDAYRHALKLDGENSRLISLEGKINLLDWKWEDARVSFQRAIKADPHNLDARHWYCLYLAAMGQLDAALTQSDTIKTMDPAGAYNIGRGSILYFARQNEELKELMIETIQADTSVAWGYDWLGMAYIEMEDYDQSVETYYKAFELSDGTVEVGAGLGHALGLAGDVEKARQMADFYSQKSKDHYLPSVQRAFIHIGLGEHDEAITLLQQAYSENSWFLVFIQVEPWYDPIRGDERFESLIRKMEFPSFE